MKDDSHILFIGSPTSSDKALNNVTVDGLVDGSNCAEALKCSNGLDGSITVNGCVIGGYYMNQVNTMNKNSLYIPVHSVSDLITNSSSTTYTMATDETIKAIKEIINSLLSMVGSAETADTLFEFSLLHKLDLGCNDGVKNKASTIGIKLLDKWGTVLASDEQIAALKKSLTEDELDYYSEDNGRLHDILLCVTPKDENNPTALNLKKSVERIIDTYHCASSYDG